MSTETHLQRAELLADLGRYDDAAEELAYALAAEPANVPALTLLARVWLAAGRPDEALDPADRAVAAGPPDLGAVAVRGLVLAELDRRAEAAVMAEELLRLGPDDAGAQTMAAAILADVRNGQLALDAAWRGVRLAPEQAQAHLVLGLVAFRLELFDLAERAYRESLRLDPQLAVARHDIGLIRFEQRRYAEGLDHLVQAAAASPSDAHVGRSVGQGLHRVLWTGAGYALIAPLLAAIAGAGGSGGGSRLPAFLLAAAGLIGMAVFAGRLPGRVTALLPGLLRADRALGVALAGVAAAPLLLLVYGVVGTPWPLVLALLGGFAALFAVSRATR